MNLNLFFGGYDTQSYKYMGVHPFDGGIEARVWAPHADKVELFTSKDDFKTFYPLKKVDDRGIWYLHLEDFKCIYAYRYRITTSDKVAYKSDPYAFLGELRPANASVMYDLNYYHFSDQAYMKKRNFSYDNPLNIYEVHVNGFKHEDGKLTTYKELKEDLIPYVKQMGYTHIELMPINEHPFDGSWGYQGTGFFAATSRYGTPYDLMDFINECHLNDIGVILDVSYVHFAPDGFGLANFDGSACFEKDNKQIAYSQWGSLYFDFTNPVVTSFLMSSANFFLNEYHFDGLRLDAISNLIFYEGNKDKGENHEGIEFIKRFNRSIKKEHPDVLIIAEDSSDYPKVTAPQKDGGLGFDYKWDLGWMNDTLKYYAMDPEYRQYHHNMLTFSMAYFYSEKFLLPFSHDEVVHSKATIVQKMWGLYEDKFRQCRNLFLYMFAHPGKKLNFLGNDMAMFREFDETRGLDWDILQYPAHDSFHRYFKDLCQMYKAYPAFYSFDYDPKSFRWIDADNNKQSIYSFFRMDKNYYFLVILNMKPISYQNYRIGIPEKGRYKEIINSENTKYGGCGYINDKLLYSSAKEAHGYKNSIAVNIAPYGAMVLRAKKPKMVNEQIINKDKGSKK